MANTRRDAPSPPNQVPFPVVPRRVSGVSSNTQRSVTDESFGRETALEGWVQEGLQTSPRVLRRQHERGVDWAVNDFEAYWCVVGTSRDLVDPSGRDLLPGLRVDYDEGKVGIDRTSAGGDVDVGPTVTVSTGAVTDHGDVRVDGSRLGLENKPVPDGEVPADRAVGDIEIASQAFGVLCGARKARRKEG